MSVTALAEVDRPVEVGALVRLYVPGIEAVPPLGPAKCGFVGCILRATRLEPVGNNTIFWVATCDSHRLIDDPEPSSFR